MVILRPLPEEGQLTTNEVHVQQGPDIELPRTPPSRFTWNRETAKAKLSEFTGIETPPVLTNFASDDWRESGPANIRHCAPYLFQPQDVIASRNTTFPGIEGGFERLHTIDALRYFLGVFTVDALRKKYELRRLLLERNRARRQTAEARTSTADADSYARDLWEQARALGVLGEQRDPETLDQLNDGLRKLLTEGRFKVHDESTDLYAQAQTEESELLNKLAERQTELAKFQDYRRIEARHAATSAEQMERLRLKDLLPTNTPPDRCPLCGEGALSTTGIRARLDESVQALENLQVIPTRIRSQLERRSRLLEEEVDGLKKALERVRTRMRTILMSRGQDRTMVDRVSAIGRFQGLVEGHLRIARTAAQAVHYDSAELDERIAELDKAVGDAAIARKLEEVQSIVSTRMTVLATDLDVEFPGKPVRLNLNELAIEVAVDASNFVPLNQLGSGANWLGYHVVACLALHEYFRIHSRPVPAILLLDQPSQVWFPAAEAKFGGRVQPADPQDIQSLNKVYELLAKFAHGKDAPQIIAFDHARLGTPSFQSAMIEDWHEPDAGLVPKEWLLPG